MSQKRVQAINDFLLNPDHSEERSSIILSAAHHACGIDLFAYDTLEEMPEKEADTMFGLIGDAIQAIAATEEKKGKSCPNDQLLTAAVDAIAQLGEHDIPDEFYEETGMVRN